MMRFNSSSKGENKMAKKEAMHSSAYYQNLNDQELKLSILDNLKNDGRLDLEQLEISCRKGVVYLEGIIPSEIEHQILLRTLTDVMGISSLTDRIQINELDWEREDVAPGTADPEPTPYEQVLYDEEPFTENIFESEEDEIPYDLPDKAPPEKIDKQAE
jgi:hypothetical protein